MTFGRLASSFLSSVPPPRRPDMEPKSAVPRYPSPVSRQEQLPLIFHHAWQGEYGWLL